MGLFDFMLPLLALVFEFGLIPLNKGVEFMDLDPELETREDLEDEVELEAEGRIVLGDRDIEACRFRDLPISSEAPLNTTSTSISGVLGDAARFNPA